tara:strand:- start:5990 stop:7474 length:1485 start_codon:yes stop_codon:yes gene_type:complete
MNRQGWVDIDLDGLGKILERRGGKYFAVYELLSNSWDPDNTKNVDITLKPEPNCPAAHINVTDDDPDGFSDLRHAFTMFAESEKKSDPRKAGRFNQGEKLFLAICAWAEIASTKGTIKFQPDGTRHKSQKRTKAGSSVTAVMKMTRAELQETFEALDKIIPPVGITTTINGKEIPHRKPIITFVASLKTEISDEEGNLKPTLRKTEVQIIETLPNEVASIYELGIPVVETGDKYHVNILQKVPLNMDRDNVTPAFLQQVRTVVFNHTYKLLDDDDATDDWVNKATSDEKCEDEAFEKAMHLRFGNKRVSNDLSDPEGTKKAMSKGYEIVFGGSLTKGQWKNARRSDAIKPAGRVTPSDKPYSPHGTPLNKIEVENWTPQMHRVVEFYKRMAINLLAKSIYVVIANDSKLQAAATYGPGGILVLNKMSLGSKFFDNFPDNMEEVCNLFIHELGHEFSGDHLSEKYYNSLTMLGARMVTFALKDPKLFDVKVLENV